MPRYHKQILYGLFLLGLVVLFVTMNPSVIQSSEEIYLQELEAVIMKGAEHMTTEELSLLGELIIFGRIVNGNPTDRDVGRGQCSLCHTFKEGQAQRYRLDLNLYGIIERAAERIREPRYLNPDTVQTESFPGSGRATTVQEYLAESNVCTSCYVVEGYFEIISGNKYSKESPMPPIHKPPTSMKIDEMIAIDTWIYINQDKAPPPVSEMRAAYEKFIPLAERH